MQQRNSNTGTTYTYTFTMTGSVIIAGSVIISEGYRMTPSNINNNNVNINPAPPTAVTPSTQQTQKKEVAEENVFQAGNTYIRYFKASTSDKFRMFASDGRITKDNYSANNIKQEIERESIAYAAITNNML